MSEQVIRHRGARRDEDGKITPAAPDATLSAFAVEPRGGSPTVERARNGETIACTVYFVSRVDLVDGDELTVRDQRFPIIVNVWNLDGRGGLEVLCTRGQG